MKKHKKPKATYEQIRDLTNRVEAIFGELDEVIDETMYVENEAAFRKRTTILEDNMVSLLQFILNKIDENN